MDMTEALTALDGWQGRVVSVMVAGADIAPFPGAESDLTPETAGPPAPFVVMRGTLGAHEMVEQQRHGEQRSVAFFPIGSEAAAGPHG